MEFTINNLLNLTDFLRFCLNEIIWMFICSRTIGILPRISPEILLRLQWLYFHGSPTITGCVNLKHMRNGMTKNRGWATHSEQCISEKFNRFLKNLTTFYLHSFLLYFSETEILKLFRGWSTAWYTFSKKSSNNIQTIVWGFL